MKKSELRKKDDALLDEWERAILRQDYLESKYTEDFTRAVIKNESGRLLTLDEIHLQWHTFIREQREQGRKRIGILSGRDFGKTVNSLGVVLPEISENTDIRAKVVTNDDNSATKRVSALESYILEDPDYLALYGDRVRPARKREWSKHAFFLGRESRSIDPTLEAFGVMTGGGTSSRSDFIWFDDICDEKVLLSRAHREAVKIKFYNSWINTLEPDGWALVNGTAWHLEDLYHELVKNPEWVWLIQRVSEDFTHIEQVIVNG